MPGRFHVASEIGSAWWRALSSIGMTPERFHGLPGWQQRLGKLAVGGVVAFLVAILVNVLEASFGATGNPSILTFDGSAYLAFLVIGLIYVPEWGNVPLIGKIAIPLAAFALAITFPYWSGHMFTIPVFGEFPSVETDYVHVDAACIYFLDWPARFDVIVTDNMFGDIITDLGAMIQGGMGIAAGGNINPAGVSMFEPIGGTAPSETGKGTINPLAAIGAMEMLLRQLGEAEAAERVDRGIRAATGKMRSMRAGEMGFSTAEVGDLVVEGASA